MIALRWIAACVLALFPAMLFAQGRLPWEEYDKHVDDRRSISPLDASSMFGDKIDLYTGALSFSVTDVSLPGNNALPVQVVRRYSASSNDDKATNDNVFADWDIDIPNVNGVFGPDWHANRCSSYSPPVLGSLGQVAPEFYWQGNHADMPGGGVMLQPNPARQKPSVGGPFHWVTPHGTHFSCFEGIRNGTGQGFLGLTTGGVKYRFDHMAQYYEDSYHHPNIGVGTVSIQRRRNALYVSRVEDRLGNWVQYSYDNAFNQPLKVTRIWSNDGRSLDFTYNTNGQISSVTDGQRTWSYTYQTYSLPSPRSETPRTLTAVTLPDTSKWLYQLSATSSLRIKSINGDDRHCFAPILVNPNEREATGQITHPSGAKAAYVMQLGNLGRTNVPVHCLNYSESVNVPGLVVNKSDDFPLLPRTWKSWMLSSRTIEGVGAPTMTWSYAISAAASYKYRPGQTKPICQDTDCLEPMCLEDACSGFSRTTVTRPDGSWERHTFGNSYLFNEGRLVRQEEGGSTGTLLSTTFAYNNVVAGQPYQAKVGSSQHPRLSAASHEYVRPLVRKTIDQDGAPFVWSVDIGCTQANQYCFDVHARPTKVVKTGVTSGVTTGTSLVLPPAGVPQLTVPASSISGAYVASWTSVATATSYQLQESLGSGAWALIQDTSATSRNFSGKPSGTWNYRVRACNAMGCSAWSLVATNEVLLPPTAVPVLNAPANSNTGDYGVSWTLVQAATRYELDHQINGGQWQTIQDADMLSAVFDGNPAGTYNYRVRACNESGCAGYSPNSTTQVVSVLAVPTLTAPGLVSPDFTYVYQWTSISGASEYQLQRAAEGNAYGLAYAGTATSVSLRTRPGTFRYRVRACNTTGCSSYSNVKIVVSAHSGSPNSNSVVEMQP